MEFLKRILISLTFFISCLAVALLGIAFGTEYWIVCKDAVRRDSSADGSSAPNSHNSRHTFINLSFGLFKGYRERNFGYGLRTANLTIACLPKESVCMWSTQPTKEKRDGEIREEFYNKTSTDVAIEKAGFFDFQMWLVTIVFLGLAIFFGLLAIFFAGYNVVTTPVGSLAGIFGLYVWNVAANLNSLICICLWVATFYSTFRDNVLTPDDIRLGWTSKDKAYFGFSFWIILGAIFLFMLNCVLLTATSLQNYFHRKTQTIGNVKTGGEIMIY